MAVSLPPEALPPHNLEAEQSVLGALLIDSEAVARVAEFLRPEDFFRPAHQPVYRAILHLYEQGTPADIVTLCDYLERRNELEAVGGEAYLADLQASVPTSYNVEHYARIVERTATLRRLIDAAGSIARVAYDDKISAEQAIREAEAILFKVAQGRQSGQMVPVSEVIHELFAKIDERVAMAEDEALPGVPTGFVDLDKMTGGFQPSDLIIVAARTSMGKTAMALSIALNSAGPRYRKTVAIFSLEMSNEQLVQRLIAAEAGLDLQLLRTGRLDRLDWGRLADAMGRLADAPIFLDDTSSLTLVEIRGKARRLKAEHGLDMIVIDYLQLIQATGGENRNLQISAISRGLKALAKELHVPIVAVSQLSRAVEGRQSHKPMLSDLRESGSIEQDADMVLLIYRDDHYNKESEKAGIAEVNVAKHRNGPTRTIELRFLEAQARFVDMDLYHMEDEGEDTDD